MMARAMIGCPELFLASIIRFDIGQLSLHREFRNRVDNCLLEHRCLFNAFGTNVQLVQTSCRTVVKQNRNLNSWPNRSGNTLGARLSTLFRLLPTLSLPLLLALRPGLHL